MAGRFFSRMTLGGKIAAFSIATFFLLVLAGLVYANFPTVSNQGYAPEQPIPFSHALHAGKYKINCQYCHIFPERSRHSTVPAVSVCLNCHRVVKTQSPWIQKLQKAAREGKAIPWVRVHELPDFVYFSHQAHVKKGIDCTVCHGDVASMDRVYQKSPLTMGWCLNCHRGHTAPAALLEKISQRGPHGEIAPTSCSTCHY